MENVFSSLNEKIIFCICSYHLCKVQILLKKYFNIFKGKFCNYIKVSYNFQLSYKQELQNVLIFEK